jgi:hypothetical protein
MNMEEQEEDFQPLLAHIANMHGKRAFLNRGK